MKKKIQLLFAGLFMLASFILVACSSTSTSKSTETTTTTESAETTVADVTITGANGEVTLTSTPQKIVVLDNGVADTLRALGQDDKIVGMPTDSLPAYLKDINKDGKITNVGNLKEVDLETIASLEPDLIIASGRTSGQIEEFEKIAPTVYFSADTANYWSSVQTNILEVAKLFGEDAEKEAKSQIADIQTIVDKAAAANKDTASTTLTVMLNEGNMAGVAANGRYSFIYSDLGFKATSLVIEEQQRGGGGGQGNGQSSDQQGKSEGEQGQSQGQGGGGGNHGSGLSFESVSEVNPDIIFVVDRSLAIGGDTSANSDIFNNELIQATNAAKNNNIVTLTSDLWYLSGGGLESTKLMFQEVAAYAGK